MFDLHPKNHSPKLLNVGLLQVKKQEEVLVEGPSCRVTGSGSLRAGRRGPRESKPKAPSIQIAPTLGSKGYK